MTICYTKIISVYFPHKIIIVMMDQPENQETSQPNDEEQNLLDDPLSSEASDYYIKPTRCHGCTVIIEPLLVLNEMFLNPLYVFMPQYIERREWEKLMGNETYPGNSNSCESNVNSTVDPIKGNLTLAGSATSYFTLQFTLAGCLPAILAVMFLGPFSDKAGRRHALLSASTGQMLGSLIYFVVVYFSLPMELLLVGSFIMGCSGHWYMFYAAAMAYIADVTTKVCEVVTTGRVVLTCMSAQNITSQSFKIYLQAVTS